jgi:hypothetical protein
MTQAAELVATHCGGAVSHNADGLDDTTYVAIVADDSLPDDGGIWQAYDPEGDLHNRVDFEAPEIDAEAPSPRTFVICGAGDRSCTPNIDTMLQVFFPGHLEIAYDDYQDCPEWQYLMAHASFTHTEVADLVVHTGVASNFRDAPDIVRQIVHDAKQLGMTWILFNLGQ